MGKILVGISGWADPGLLLGGFYPPELKTGPARLQYYADNFPLVEMDSSYHVIPGRRNVDAWLAAVPSGFVFDLKAFSLFTQHPTAFTAIPPDLRSQYAFRTNRNNKLYLNDLGEKEINSMWGRFIAAITPVKLARKLGVVFFQFPPWFVPKPENLEYVIQCKERLSGFRMAVEFRRSTWFDEERHNTTLDFLRDNGISLICVDEPQGFKTSIPPIAEATASLAIVRFHGRNGTNWEKKGLPPGAQFAYLYTEKELNEWLPKIRSLAEKTEELHLIFKNKYRDYEVQNARQMLKLLQK